MKRSKWMVLLAMMAVAVAWPGQAGASSPRASASAKAPYVVCMRLDRAERKLRRAGFRVREHGGGVFGIVIKEGWVVVRQSTHGHTTDVWAARRC